MLLFNMKNDFRCDFQFHIGLSMDHKFFPLMKKWALGCMLTITLVPFEDEPLNASYLLGLYDCTNPRLADKGAETTAKFLVTKMKEISLWQFRNHPEVNIALDGALSENIVPFLIDEGWPDVALRIILCEGHTIACLYKIIYNYLFNDILKNKHWACKFFEIY